MQLTETFSLYVHIPWCYKKCPYCDFNAYDQNIHQPDFIQYFRNLDYELARLKAHYPWKKKILSLYFGGGTPSVAPPELIRSFIQKIQLYFNVDCLEEITMEVSPRSPQENLPELRSAGINRFSLGLQSFDPQILTILGREHTAEMTDQTLKTLLSLPETRLNIDLIYGLEEQSVNQVLDDLKKACSLGVEHISWYELTIEPNTLFAKKNKKKMSPELLDHVDLLGKTFLKEQGYVQYEVSAFTRKKRSRHNCAYWAFEDYLSLGAGAHSKVVCRKDKLLRTQVTRYPKDYLNFPRLKTEPSFSDDLDFLLCQLRVKGLVKKEEILAKVPLKCAQKILKWFDYSSKEFPALIEVSGDDFYVTEKALQLTLSLLESYQNFTLKL